MGAAGPVHLKGILVQHFEVGEDTGQVTYYGLDILLEFLEVVQNFLTIQ